MDRISELAKRFRLSRSTLLYYDRIGLLSSSARSRAGYRRYSEQDVARLEKICFLRRAGVTLKDIAKVLDSKEDLLGPALERRLVELDAEMEALKAQQHLIASLLQRSPALAGTPCMDKTTWVSLLRASGFTDRDMDAWHAHFERLAPEKHQRFLEFLGILPADIQRIRSASTLDLKPHSL